MQIRFLLVTSPITITVSAPCSECPERSAVRFGLGDDLCTRVRQLIRAANNRVRQKQEEGYAECRYAFTRLQKSLGSITSSCLIFAKKQISRVKVLR